MTYKALRLLGALFVLGTTAAHAYDLKITGGVVQGPGPMPDTPLPQGLLSGIELNDKLAGISPFFNNGAAEPNLPTENEFYGHLGATMSDGTPFNEHLTGGIVTIGGGALKMYNVIPNSSGLKGTETYQLDDRLNWEIHTDLGLDPGFPQGIVISPNIKIYSGVLKIDLSRQTEAGYKGGADRAGSVPSGAPVYGMLGDMDNRGFLDGRIVGAGRAPLEFMFVPGGPLVMQREFRSNIPVTHEQAGVLTYAGLLNLRDIFDIAQDPKISAEARSYVREHAVQYLDDFAARAHSAQFHLNTAGPAYAEQARQAAAIEAVLREKRADAATWAARGEIPAKSFAAINEVLIPVQHAIPELRAKLRFPQISGGAG